jgi:DNA-binding NarL/FixJ family response regulator
MVLQITPRERAVLQSLADGEDVTRIARSLGTSEREAQAQLTALYARIGARTRTEAIAAAFSRGLLVAR